MQWMHLRFCLMCTSTLGCVSITFWQYLQCCGYTTELAERANQSVKRIHISSCWRSSLRHLKLSLHLILGLPLGLLPSISPTYTFFVALSLFISRNLRSQFSCLLFITSTMHYYPSCCPISSLPIFSILLTPCILLSTFICVACTFVFCCFVKLHSQARELL